MRFAAITLAARFSLPMGDIANALDLWDMLEKTTGTSIDVFSSPRFQIAL